MYGWSKGTGDRNGWGPQAGPPGSCEKAEEGPEQVKGGHLEGGRQVGREKGRGRHGLTWQVVNMRPKDQEQMGIAEDM